MIHKLRIIFLAGGIAALVLALSARGQMSEEFWEGRNEDDELSFILEAGWWNRAKVRAGYLGYELILPKPKTEADSLKSAASDYDSNDEWNFRLSSRGSGEELNRQMARSAISAGDKYRLGFVIERDAGEEWGDFYAGHLSYSAPELSLVMGNYSAGFGQGLVLWRGFDWGAYPEKPISPMKADFLRGFESTSENGALFGAGGRLEKSAYSLSLLYSDSRWDASGDENAVVTLQTSGLHSTPSQLENKDRLREKLWGCRLSYNLSKRASLGLSGTNARYSPPFASDDSVRRAFDFAGNENNALGTDFAFESELVKACGEIARMKSGGIGALMRVQFITERMMVEILGRDFDRDFRNLRSAFPDGNEKGFTIAADIRPWKGGVVKCYSDIWQRPWRTYLYSIPPEGRETSLFAGQHYKGYHFGLRLRRTVSDRGGEELTRGQVRVNLERKFRRFSLRFRVERSMSDDGGAAHYGHIFSSGASARFISWTNIDFDITYFKAPVYDCRIYQYEYDVPGLMRAPFYLGEGLKMNMVVRFRIGRWVTIACKSAVIMYSSNPREGGSSIDRTFSLYSDFNWGK